MKTKYQVHICGDKYDLSARLLTKNSLNFIMTALDKTMSLVALSSKAFKFVEKFMDFHILESNFN